MQSTATPSPHLQRGSDRRSFLAGSAGALGILGLGAGLAACGQGPQQEAPREPAPGPGEPISLPVLEETRPVDADLSTRVRKSEEFARFAPAFAKRDVAPDFDHAVEAVYSGLPAAAAGARTVLVPLVGPGGAEVPRVWMISFNDTGREGSEIIEVLPENRFRFFVEPGLETGFDLVFNAENRLVGILLLGQIPPYLVCVFAIIAGVIGRSPGALNTCVALCSAGGITNPGCLACIGAAAGVALVAWWAC
ncbi:MAG: hypothetical protein ACE5ED_13010 [Rhodothalassiaceae bacterium]